MVFFPLHCCVSNNFLSLFLFAISIRDVGLDTIQQFYESLFFQDICERLPGVHCQVFLQYVFKCWQISMLSYLVQEFLILFLQLSDIPG